MSNGACVLAHETAASLPRARIARTRPSYLHGGFLFELIDVDGPRPGSCLAQCHADAQLRDSRYHLLNNPARDVEQSIRACLRDKGRRQGYAVTDY